MARKVLIVEDDSNIAELLHLYLEKEGFETAVAGDGGKGVELFRSFHPELVLLDIMLPVMDGWSVLKKIRENDKTPVIMLTAKGETQDKVAGLEGGADDYIVKPFEMKEVLARIHAVLRRFGGEEEGSGEKKLSFDKLVINLDSYELLVDGKRVDTPPKELELLYHLAASPNRVFTRNQLLDEVWGFDYFGLWGIVRLGLSLATSCRSSLPVRISSSGIPSTSTDQRLEIPVDLIANCQRIAGCKDCQCCVSICKRLQYIVI